MGVLPNGIFVDLVAAHRLTCHSVYRLQHLGARKFPWQEETLTEILLGHLTGVDYRIDAACPDCPHPGLHCRAWNHTPAAEISGGLRLLTRPQEGGNRRLGRDGVGADFVYSLQEPSGDREVRMLIQAKRIRTDHAIKASSLDSPQRASLLAAAEAYSAAPYYLFYAESASAHDRHQTRCSVHISPSETSLILVPVQILARMFDQQCRTSVPAADVFAYGRTLLCMDGCGADQHMPAFDRLVQFVRDDHQGYELADPRVEQRAAAPTELPAAHVIQVLTRASKPPRKIVDSGITRAGARPSLQPGQILWVHLGDWEPDDSGERDGYGWFPEITPGQLADSARMYWKLDLRRARDLRYLVAYAEGEIRGIYRIVDDSLIIHHDVHDKVSFELETIGPSTSTYQQIHHRTERYLAQRKPRARNVIGYP